MPIGRNKDGSLSKSSRALNGEDFETVLKYTKEKERGLKKEIYAGEAAAAPYELGDGTGCDYCPYMDICGFDPRIDGCTYRRLEKLSMEGAVEAMGKTVEKGNRTGGEQDEREMDERTAESD